MDRAEYNSCVSSKLKGKKFSKEERKLEFCMAAKTCSGKASSREKAAAMCNQPKLPKWAKSALPEDDKKLSCPERNSRILANLDIIGLKAKVGEAEEVKPLAAQALNDCMVCNCDTGTFELLKEAMGEVNSLSKDFYLAGEATEVQKHIELIKGLLQ